MQGEVRGNFKELNILGSDINYNFSAQTLETDKTITYTYPQLKLTAQQSFIDLRDNRIEMSGGVITEICN